MAFVLMLGRYALLASLAWLGISAPVAAQGYGDQAAHFKITRYVHNEEIAADFTSSRTLSIERQALSPNGAVAIGQYQFWFNADLEKVEVLEAYTEKPDGQKNPVSQDQMKQQTGYLVPGTQVSWPGMKAIQITFPQVQMGDKTFVSYRTKVTQAALPKWLSRFDFLVNHVDFSSFQVRLSAPESMALDVHAQGLTLQTRVENGRRFWAIDGASSNSSSEVSMANALKKFPYWLYSTLPSRTALGDNFAQTLRDKIRITAPIQTLADTITKGRSTERDKAQSIHQWVVKEMRYVAIFLGSGGFVPNDLGQILENRYGDCKDHVLLMMALLQAVGIDAAPALINTATADWTPPGAAPVYDHVLVYIPSLDLYADPTATTIPFGKLPWVDSAKPVVVGLSGGAQDRRTPAFVASDNLVQVRSDWTLNAKGDADVNLKIATRGEAATKMQNQLSQIPARIFSSAAVQRFLKAAGLKGKGTLNYPDVQRLSQEQTLEAKVEVSELLPNAQAGSINPHPMVSSLPYYALNNLGPVVEENRRFDLMCTPIRVEEAFELRFPPGTQLLSVPGNLEVNTAGLVFSSQYQADGATVRGKRLFERAATASGHICSTEEIAERRLAVEAIRKNLRDTVLFKAP